MWFLTIINIVMLLESRYNLRAANLHTLFSFYLGSQTSSKRNSNVFLFEVCPIIPLHNYSVLSEATLNLNCFTYFWQKI